MFRFVWIVALALLITGCSTEPPKAYGIGHPIPLGPYVATVEGSDFRAWENKGMLIVHFQLQCTTQPCDFERFSREYMRAFTLRDGDGKEYDGFASPDRGSGMSEAGLVEGMRNPPSNPEGERSGTGLGPERWQAVFVAPTQSRGYKLHIENAMQESGQAGAAVVDLYR